MIKNTTIISVGIKNLKNEIVVAGKLSVLTKIPDVPHIIAAMIISR